jgi:hypothetical protein
VVCAAPRIERRTKCGRKHGTALEISSFKCGQDATIYGVVEGIIEQSGTPYFCFKDLDENKPSGSIKIRVETIDYFLRRYREEVIRKRKAARKTLMPNWWRWKQSYGAQRYQGQPSRSGRCRRWRPTD